MTINDALKELYVAMGGDADDVADLDMIQEVIGKIGDVTGAQLPEPEEADKGKYAHVNGTTGALEYAEVESGGGVEVVTIAYSSGEYSCDKTYTDISTILSAGTPVICVVPRYKVCMCMFEDSGAVYGTGIGNFYSDGMGTIEATAVTVRIVFGGEYSDDIYVEKHTYYIAESE